MEALTQFFNSDSVVDLFSLLIVMFAAAVLAGVSMAVMTVISPRRNNCQQVRDANGKLLGVIDLEADPDLGEGMTACLRIDGESAGRR